MWYYQNSILHTVPVELQTAPSIVEKIALLSLFFHLGNVWDKQLNMLQLVRDALVSTKFFFFFFTLTENWKVAGKHWDDTLLWRGGGNQGVSHDCHEL